MVIVKYWVEGVFEHPRTAISQPWRYQSQKYNHLQGLPDTKFPFYVSVKESRNLFAFVAL